jgi:hypothetical protein
MLRNVGKFRKNCAAVTVPLAPPWKRTGYRFFVAEMRHPAAIRRSQVRHFGDDGVAILAYAMAMWEFSVPPHKGDEHFDLGVWHPSALPSDKQNSEGYRLLRQRVEEDWICELEEAHSDECVKAVQAFHNDIDRLVDAIPEEESDNRPWSIVLRCNPLFCLISLWPAIAADLSPAILKSAKQRGLVCYDPQNNVLSIP